MYTYKLVHFQYDTTVYPIPGLFSVTEPDISCELERGIKELRHEDIVNGGVPKPHHVQYMPICLVPRPFGSTCATANNVLLHMYIVAHVFTIHKLQSSIFHSCYLNFTVVHLLMPYLFVFSLPLLLSIYQCSYRLIIFCAHGFLLPLCWCLLLCNVLGHQR